jgi:hypothetical protein
MINAAYVQRSVPSTLPELSTKQGGKCFFGAPERLTAFDARNFTSSMGLGLKWRSHPSLLYQIMR